MDFMKEYEKWLSSPALSEAERAELEAIRNDPKEIESRFYGKIAFLISNFLSFLYFGYLFPIRKGDQKIFSHFIYFSMSY